MQFEAGMLVPLQDAASGCCFRVLLLERRVRFGAGLLLPLPGAAAGCSRLLLDGADVWQVRFWSCWCGCQAVRMLCAFGAGLLVPLPGAAAKDCLHLRNFEAGAGCRCQSSKARRPDSSTLQRHSMPALKRAHHSDSSTLKQHHAAAPCSGTNMPAPKCRQATPPILEVRTPIASLSGEQCLPVGATASMVAALKVHRLQWQADLGHSLVHTTSKQSSVPSAVRLCQMRRKAALVKQSPKVPKTPTSSTEH